MSNFIPEGFGPEDDMNHERPEDTPNWSESHAFWMYWEDRYFYMHFQRQPDDSGMWRANVSIQGEDGSNIISHTFGRELSSLGPGNQCIHAVCERPFESYRVEVDTVAQLSSWNALRDNPLQSFDDQITPVKLELQFVSVSETYAPVRGAGTAAMKWTHYTPCRVHGFVTIGNERKFVDTLGFRDHSAGARSYGNLLSGYMLTGIVPSGRSYMAIGVGSRLESGEVEFRSMGGVTIDGKVSYATKIDVSDKIISMPEPGADLGELRFETEDHGESVIKLRATNQGVPFTNQAPCYEVIGLTNKPGDLIYHDWRVDIEWDGEKGVGGWEPCIQMD